MATRNERKRAAKAKREAILTASLEAIAREASKPVKVDLAKEYPCFGETPCGKPGYNPRGGSFAPKVFDRAGKIVAGKFAPPTPSTLEPKPLKGDGHGGRGELRVRYVR